MKVKEVLKDIADQARFIKKDVDLSMGISIRTLATEKQTLVVRIYKTSTIEAGIIEYAIEYHIGHVWNDIQVLETPDYAALSTDVLLGIQREVRALSNVFREKSRLAKIANEERSKKLDEFLNQEIGETQ